MLKRIIVFFASLFIVAGTAQANHLPQEDFSRMNPTVKIVSYKYKFAGHVVAYGSGSGTVISPDGLVVSNNHVIFDEIEQKPLDAFEICITFDVQKEPVCKYTANLIARDKDMDISLLKIQEEDVFGNPLPPLKNLNFNTGSTPQEQSEVNVVGYPASGGESITLNKGQVSGFEEFNGYKYFKTDTDFDHGNSGGTALDGKGNYIGIPTYIRSFAENVGYFLDIREAHNWINSNLKKDIITQNKAEQKLKTEMQRFFEANETLKYENKNYPQFSIELPEDWHFAGMDENQVFAAQKNVNNGASINIVWDDYAFEINDAYLKEIDKEFLDVRQMFPDFKKEAVKFDGQEGWRITYTSYNQRNTVFIVPYGYCMMYVMYSIDLDEEQKQKKAIKEVIDSFKFTQTPHTEPNLPNSVEYTEPAFKMSVFDNWRIQKPKGGRNGDLMAKAMQQNNFEGQFAVYYSFTPKDQRELNAEEKLDDITENFDGEGAKVTYKKKDVVMDGLKGYLYTIEYEGDEYQQLRKRLTIELTHGEYKFTIQYDDVANNFDKNLPTIQKMLRSFEFEEENTEKGKYEFGALGQRFRDLRHHRFAGAISALADKDIVEGFRDGRFRPEFFIHKGQALKIILESKNHLEKEKKLGNAVHFDNYEKKDVWFDKYANYAKEKKWIRGNFKAYDNLTLNEALKWIMDVYEIPVWKGYTPKWHKPYMDKAYELGWLPRGMDNPDQILTRGELSYLVNEVYNQAK